MQIHAIIHAEFENLGAIENWAIDNHCSITKTHTYNGEKLPSQINFDFLIVMGGPQSPLRFDKWPYLQDEIQLIQKTIKANKPILGVCLGAQLIGESLGKKTSPSPHREIGVFPIQLLPEAQHDFVFKQFPSEFNAMHWHNDMPGIPDGAKLLAKSSGCPQQAFSVDDRIYGLQFHLEMTPQNIIEMINHCEEELNSDIYVESAQKLLSYDLKETNEKLFLILDHLSSKVI